MHDLVDLCRRMCREELLEQAKQLATQERALLYELLARMSVIDEFSFFRPYASMFEYARRELGFSEAVAFGRIRVARLARDVPEILVHIREGTMPISHFERVASQLTRENCEKIVAEVRSMSSREVERYVAGLQPQPTPADVVRALPPPAPPPSLPEASAAGEPPGPLASSGMPESAEIVPAQPARPPRDEVEWLSGSITLFRFGAALVAFLEKNGPGAGTDRAGKMTGSRRIPKWVRRKVWKRDEGRCTYVEPDGRRCGSTAYLEFHHRVPWALGGRSDDPDNLCLLCGSHHRWRSEEDSARAESVDNSGPPPEGAGASGP